MKTKNMVAYCGLVCTDCEAYLATQDNDMVTLAKLAARAQEELGLTVTPEENMCDGCLTTTGRQFPYCQTCIVRSCGVARGVENCARCRDYPCKTLLSHASPSQKATLDALRAQP